MTEKLSERWHRVLNETGCKAMYPTVFTVLLNDTEVLEAENQSLKERIADIPEDMEAAVNLLAKWSILYNKVESERDSLKAELAEAKP